jgi:MGT family glycosyltransferase
MHGHVNPTLELVKELVRRGEEVIYYTTETFQKKIRGTGAECRFYAHSGSRLKRGAEPDMIPGENKGRENSFEKQIENVFANAATRMEDVKTQEQDLYEEIKMQEPDYIVYDYIDAYWGKVLAQKLEIPAIASIPSFAMCDKFIKRDPRGVIKYILHMSPDDPPFINKSIDIRELIDFISHRIATSYNLKDFNILNFGNSELLNIVYNSQYFQPHGEVFDETFKFIGCSIGTREESVDFPYERLDKKPIIFISLGTNFNRRIDFYKQCFKALPGTGNQVILSVGNRIDLAELGNIPGNFIVRRFVPQLEILKRSSLFITHGGLNSVKEGIYYTVPLIVFPQDGDQFAVGYQVSRLGAGICIEHANINAEELGKTAEKVYTNDTFRQNCIKIRESFERAGGAKRAVDEIFKLKKRLTIR